jgi:CheY-like chemotaxis protein
MSIWADDRRIRQVLINLLNNAVKFTPEGGTITLDVQLAATVPDEPLGVPLGVPSEGQVELDALPGHCPALPPQTIVFSVTDTGIGIAPENLSQLFRAFVQIDSNLNRQYAGTGLGLALVKQIVELHGGTVSVESELNRGSCFRVHLPLIYSSTSNIIPPEPAPNPALMPANNHQVVVIDDAPAASDLVARYLHDLGMQATIYLYGEGACAEILRLQPALVILDLQLPNISGWDILVQLKQHPQTKTIPVIVTSVVDECQRGLSLGASAYLVKPFTRSEFNAVVQKLRSPLFDLATPPVLPLILLAEDNIANVETLTGYLESRGYRLMVAETGQKAIDLAQVHAPDMILMDIQMPGMDGLEATRRMREKPELAQTPIIALTALAMPGDREKCLAAGANQYLTKPIRLKELVTTIQSFLQPPDGSG